MDVQQQLCAPFTPREESSPWGLACDWHCDAAARPRVTKKTKKKLAPALPAPMPIPTLRPALPHGPALHEQW